MFVIKNRNITFSITVKGYEFPKSSDDWDANWLIIKIDLDNKIDNVVFSGEDPALLTTELIDLKNWLISLKQKNKNSEIHFMEPNLAFAYSNETITIFLDHDFNPNGLDSNTYSFKIDIKALDLDSLIQNMNKIILAFPKKYNPC